MMKYRSIAIPARVRMELINKIEAIMAAILQMASPKRADFATVVTAHNGMTITDINMAVSAKFTSNTLLIVLRNLHLQKVTINKMLPTRLAAPSNKMIVTSTYMNVFSYPDIAEQFVQVSFSSVSLSIIYVSICHFFCRELKI